MSNKNSIFDFRDYKAYLRFRMSTMERGGRGFRSDLANAANCQSGYVSQVLNSSAHFSLEQASGINKLLGHRRPEARYFLLLIEYARAGNTELRRHFSELIDESIQSQFNMAERFQIKQSLSEIDQMIYYGEWWYAAVQVLVSIPAFQSVESISRVLDLPEPKIREILEFLRSRALVLESNGRYRVGTTRIHLGKDSPLLNKHHINWRLQAMQSLDREQDGSLRYTSVISVSEADVVEIKRRLLKCIDEYNSIVKDSADETLYCLSLDFFCAKRG